MKVPSLLLWAVKIVPVLLSVTVICALGTTAPCGSNTVPVIEPCSTWAAAKETASNQVTKNPTVLDGMCTPLSKARSNVRKKFNAILLRA